MKKEIAKKLIESNKVVICSHVRPDGDSIGSGLALFYMLIQLGKEVRFRNFEEAPSPFHLLPGYENIEHEQIYPDNFDVVVLIESGNKIRSGMNDVDKYFTINIDHHATSPLISDINWVDPEASAVGELIYELGQELKIDFTYEIGFNLYAAIISDTGSFKYSNTSYKTLKISSEIVKRSGINPYDVSDLIFNSNPPEKIELLKKILSTLKFSRNGSIASVCFKRGFVENFSSGNFETEDIIAIVRSITGVRVTIFIKEIRTNFYRASVRSKGDVSSYEIAHVFDGGGHKHAAGFFIEGEYEEIWNKVTRAASEYLELKVDGNN